MNQLQSNARRNAGNRKRHLAPSKIQNILSSAPEGLRTALQNPRVRRWVLYAVKAIALVGLFCLLTQLAPHMPAIGVALFWAVLSAISALGLAYASVIRKTHKRSKYAEGGMMYRLNEGRVFSLIVVFVLAAVCAAGLIMEAPKWGMAIWALIVAAIPVYAIVFVLAGKRMRKEYNAPYQASSAIKWSGWIVGLLLCAAYAAVVFAQPAAHYASITEAFVATQLPFDGSPSILMSEAGIANSFAEGLVAFGSSEATGDYMPLYVFIRIVLVASSFFGIANLLGTCALELQEIRRIFAPLDASESQDRHSALIKRYAVTAGVLPLVLMVAFVGANFKVGEVASTGEYTPMQSFVRDRAGLTVAEIDGKFYDYKLIEDLIVQTEEKSDSLSEEAKETLVPLINASYDKRIENVDSYLDWYYSLPADYERLANAVTGSAEEFVEEQFTAKIEEGIDDTAISDAFSEFEGRTKQIATDAESALQDAEIEEIPNMPDWLLETEVTLNTDFLSEPMESVQKFSNAETMRPLVSAGAGLAAGVMTKAATKPFFNKFVTKIATALGSRGLGAAAGGAVGSAAGPLGTIAGIAAGTALGIGVDAAMLAVDEMQNRDTYKQEIVDAIEEERAATLAMVE